MSVWPLLAIVILHNGIFRFGFFNYVFGLGLALAASGLWMALKPGTIRLAIAALCCVVLIFCHLEAFGIFAIVVGTIEIEGAFTRYALDGFWRTVGGLLYSVLPFLACALLFVLFSPTAGAIGNGFEYWGFRHRLTLALFSLSSGNIWLDAFSIFCVAGLSIWLVANRYLAISRPLLLASIAIVICLFLIPSQVMGGSYADIRLGPAAAALLVAALDLRLGSSKKAQATVLALVLALAVVRSIVLTQTWNGYGDQIAPIAATIERLEPGAILFAATTQPQPDLILFRAEQRAAWQPPLKHVASFAVLGNPIFVPMTFADPTQQPLNIRLAYRPLATFQGTNPVVVPDSPALLEMITSIQSILDKGNWRDTGRVYLLLVDPKPLEPLSLPESVFQTAFGDRFALLQFKKTTCDGSCSGSTSAKEK